MGCSWVIRRGYTGTAAGGADSAKFEGIWNESQRSFNRSRVVLHMEPRWAKMTCRQHFFLPCCYIDGEMSGCSCIMPDARVNSKALSAALLRSCCAPLRRPDPAVSWETSTCPPLTCNSALHHLFDKHADPACSGVLLSRYSSGEGKKSRVGCEERGGRWFRLYAPGAGHLHEWAIEGFG
eukprot:752528-Hanusia_phi.AAC.1